MNGANEDESQDGSKPRPKKLSDLVPGDIDPVLGKKVVQIVQKGDGYIIYLDEHDEMSLSIEDEYGALPECYERISSKVKIEVGFVRDLFSNRKRQRRYYSLLGQSLASMLQHRNDVEATKLLQEAESTIRERGNQLLKIEYIVSSFCTTILVGILLVTSWLFRHDLICVIDEKAFEILIAGLCGGIGAFISSFIRSFNFKGDIRLPRWTYRLDGSLRIFYGNIAGFVIALSVKANVLFGMIDSENDGSLGTLAFFATVAGASETLVPSIIKKIEGN